MNEKTMPLVPVEHPDFKWTSGADVQALWRKYGWAPPSEALPTPPPEKPMPVAATVAMPRIRRLK
jgi:hypothetical protein